MGKINIKYKKHMLHVSYQLDKFEELLTHELNYVETLHKYNDKKYLKKYNQHYCLIDYVRRYITVLEFDRILMQIMAILEKMIADYIPISRCFIDMKQWIIDDMTKEVKLIFIHSIGCQHYLTFEQFITHLIDSSIFHRHESVNKILYYLNHCATIMDLHQALIKLGA